MTSRIVLDAILPLVDDLARELSDGERYRRLLGILGTLFPSDASAVLKLTGNTLVPLATTGLSRDTLGRRFKVAEHPRFTLLLASPAPVRFPADSPLPDPYDGLVQGAPEQLEVHDCMGCAVLVDGRPWGLLTLDTLDPARFADVDVTALQAFARLTASVVRAAEHMRALGRRSQEERERAEAYRHAAPARREMIGKSAAHKRMLGEIATVGPSELTVLVTGETGVGKELVAHALHAASPRAAKPMISLNCAALPDNLIESELFGHVRGAFSGAVGERRGRFELADGGTLFLDEVGELSLPAQAKLLRVLQSGHLQRVGSDREHRVDVRVIAATNRDLASEVREGRYRADLYHRLSVYPLHVPPLRERGRDTLLLAGFFLEENRARLGLHTLRLSPDAQAALLAYRWPGNVRELEHLIGRSALRALAGQGGQSRMLSLGTADLDLAGVAGVDTPAGGALIDDAPPGQGLRDAVEAYERRLVDASLARHGGSWAAAARELRMDRANLSRLARRLGIK